MASDVLDKTIKKTDRIFKRKVRNYAKDLLDKSGQKYTDADIQSLAMEIIIGLSKHGK